MRRVWLSIVLLVCAESAAYAAPALEFPSALPWLNVSRPLTLAELRGKVVLLDFWTYCCINCMQALPDLKAIEQKYAGRGLVVVGVHSGKFDNEKDAENIRAAVRRYGITHPVVDDAESQIWERFGVQAWPTFVVIAPDGEVITRVAGEGHKQELEHAIDGVIAKATPGALAALKPEEALAGTLAFAGKIIAQGKRLFIADSGHDRVIEARDDGKILASYGGLHRPQGMVVDGETLYVADTEAHVVRAIDRKTKRMRIVAGTGSLGRGPPGAALQTPLASPWDLALLGRTLYIANAGTHQILALDLDAATLSVAAGSGREDLRDGDAAEARLAQPSGLTTDGRVIYFADSETSSIRRFDPRTRRVDTLIGKGLFDFGDVDGDWTHARLQHCLGVAWAKGALFVADSYNHKLKRIDLDKRRIDTLAAKLAEPGGVAVSGDAVFIADTNRSRIVRYDSKTKESRELQLRE